MQAHALNAFLQVSESGGNGSFGEESCYHEVGKKKTRTALPSGVSLRKVDDFEICKVYCTEVSNDGIFLASLVNLQSNCVGGGAV
jgi:hypothetical protein